jgi:coenzyme F420 biosynthesis associated uncharacterized protein
MVDWSVARQVARFAARSDDVPEPAADLHALAAEIEPVVSAYTGLEPWGTGVPEPEAVSRNAWAEANLTTLSHVLDPVAERMSDRMASAGPFAGALRIGAGVTLAAEVGLVTGWMAQRVIGQYELSLLQPEEPARLLFVTENVARAATELGADPESFLRWVTAHELTHALQFQGVPWLRGHLGGILSEYLESVDVRIERGAAGGLPSLPNPTQLVERFREGGLVALVQTKDQRELLERMQATMAVVEGHAEHVMDAVAPGLVPEHEGLRQAMDARRANRSAPDRILAKLFGFDMKLRQYEIGKSFCDAVVEAGGMELLNGVWAAPDALPTLAELDDPQAWISRAPTPA